MHSHLLFTVVIAGLLGGSTLQENQHDQGKTKEVKAGAITLVVPTAWKQTEPASSFRLAQFEIPSVEADKGVAELAVFPYSTGNGVKGNIDRWVGQFDDAERTTKTTIGESSLGPYVFVEVSGTYQKPVGAPRLRKTEPMTNARMFAVILLVKGKGNFYLKMTGPSDTVAAAATDFRASFGGNIENEEPFEPK